MSALSNIEDAKTPMVKPENLQQMLESPQFVAKIQKSLRGSMTTDIVGSLAMTQLRKIPKLAKCDPITLFGAVITCSQNGWEIGRDVHLLPFENRSMNTVDVTIIPDYRGLIKLAIQSDQVSKVEAHVVYENDVFDFELGLNETLRHKPAMKNRGEMLCTYAVVTLADGNKQYEVMTFDDIESIRKRSKSKDNGPWKTDTAMMWRKTVLRRILRYVGSSAEANKMSDLDNAHDMGEQDNRSWAGAMEGEYTDVTGNSNAKAPEKKVERKPRRTKAQVDAEARAKAEAKRTPPPVVQGNDPAPEGNAAGSEPAKAGGDTQPAGGKVDPNAISYAKVAQGINGSPTEQDSQAWLNTARGALSPEHVAELVQLHLNKWVDQANG